MLLVILGAGASHDSVSPGVVGKQHMSFAHRPPLADHLCSPQPLIYGEALDRFPSCRPIIDRLRRANSGRSLEEELDEIAAEADEVPALHRQLLGFRYYVRDVIIGCAGGWLHSANGMTNYVSLVRTIEHWRAPRDERVLFITFNYDLLLERALVDVVGAQFNHIDKYIGREDYFVVKPHGSVNWVRRMLNPDIVRNDRGRGMAPDVVNWAAEAQWSDSIDVADEEPLNRGGFENLTIDAPALTVPLRRKARFECPDAHLHLLGELLPEVDRALIIGWRGLEEHFTENLSHVGLLLPTLIIVTESDEASIATLDNIGACFGTPRLSDAPGSTKGFSDFLAGGGLADVLL
ncbi:MAG: hypothetical protein JF603_03950 [Acidobacteria bacterium]|nr:hypothetical protein [Acidobacteriota bacterium]